MEYNVQTLGFLIGSFNQMVSTFGESSKTVEFFRNQVMGLVDIGQVNLYDASLVFSLIGMTNTNAVKWDKAKNKIKSFMFGMNKLCSINNRNVQAYVLDELDISDEIKDYIKDIFNLKGIDNINKGLKEENNFGVLKSVKPINNISKNSNVLNQNTTNNKLKNGESSLELWKGLLDKATKEHILRVKNPEAVCSCDPYYLYRTVEELNIKFLNVMSNSDSVDIGIKSITDDGCHRSSNFVIDPELNNVIKKINFNDIKYMYEKRKGE